MTVEDEIKESFDKIINYMVDHKTDVMNAKITYEDDFTVCVKIKIWPDVEGGTE